MSRFWKRVAGLAVLTAAWGSAAADVNRCSLLKDGEIDKAIGAHEPGYSGVNNPWGNNSCRWVAKNAPAQKAPEGWRDSIELAVFDGSMRSWAQGQASGEPVSGVAKNARWDRTQGEMWFECAGNRICVVKVRTAASKLRQEVATQLTRLADERLR
jgi:hypothetical protein